MVMRWRNAPADGGRISGWSAIGTHSSGVSPSIDPKNAASKAVALRIGMHHERDLIFEGHPTELFALPPAPR